MDGQVPYRDLDMLGILNDEKLATDRDSWWDQGSGGCGEGPEWSILIPLFLGKK